MRFTCRIAWLIYPHFCGIIIMFSQFRSAEQGLQSYNAIVLGLIVLYILLGILNDLIKSKIQITRRKLSMKTKITNIIATFIMSICNSIWTMGANFLADALLT